MKKVYEKVIIDIASGEVIEATAFDYDGPVAELKGDAPSAKLPFAGKAVKQLWRGTQPNSPLANRLGSVGQIGADDPYRNVAVQRLTNDINAQYGARGLAGSGIGMKGVTEAIRDFDLGREEQKTNQAIQILGTASGGPTMIPGSTPRGFMGLK